MHFLSIKMIVANSENNGVLSFLLIGISTGSKNKRFLNANRLLISRLLAQGYSIFNSESPKHPFINQNLSLSWGRDLSQILTYVKYPQALKQRNTCVAESTFLSGRTGEEVDSCSCSFSSRYNRKSRISSCFSRENLSKRIAIFSEGFMGRQGLSFRI